MPRKDRPRRSSWRLIDILILVAIGYIVIVILLSWIEY